VCSCAAKNNLLYDRQTFANRAIAVADKRFSVNVSLTCGIIHRTTLSVLTVSVLLNGVMNV